MTRERTRRMRADFSDLTNRLGHSYVGVDPKIAAREISEAAKYARKATKASRSKKQT